MNRRIPNGTYGGVRGRELVSHSLLLDSKHFVCEIRLPQGKGSFYSVGGIKDAGIPHLRKTNFLGNSHVMHMYGKKVIRAYQGENF